MRRIDIRWASPTPPANYLDPVGATLGLTRREVNRGLRGLGLREQALRQRPELVEPSVNGRGEQQACRTDQQARDRVERRKGLEDDARAALHRDEDRRRDERAAGKDDRERRERDWERASNDELFDPRFGDRERAHGDEEAERDGVGVG